MRRASAKYVSVLSAVLFASVCESTAQQIVFTDVADSLSITHTYTGPFLGGGVSFYDFDGDGMEDLTLSTGSGELIHVYENGGLSFTNIASQMNCTDLFQSKTILWADYDNDGDKDLFVANYGGSDKLYRNEGGMNFVDVTAAVGILEGAWASMAACWADYNNDGFLDLYVTTYSDELTFGSIPNLLYKNQGTGSFTEVGRTAGVADSLSHPLAVTFLDYDDDGWQDIYIANDKYEGNVLFHNNGDGSFSDVSDGSGADVQLDAMGIAVGDYDDDGDLDMYVSNSPLGNVLLRNNGDGTFSDVTIVSGVGVYRGCWGVNFFDFDNDMDLDLYVSASNGPPAAYNVLFENNGGIFTATSGNGLDAETSESYGNAIGDFNNDGYCDIAVLNATAFTLWENSGGNNHWIKLKLEGTVSNRDALGALIEIYVGGSRLIRHTRCGISYLSQNTSIENIGVGSANVVDSVTVKWPSGVVDRVSGLAVNQTYYVLEGQTATGIKHEGSIPPDVVLNQNHPNPFIRGTEISYRLPKEMRVRVDVFNVLGQRVATVVDREKAAGYHAVQFDGNGLTTGVYFYRIKAGERTETRKMVLIH